MPSAVTHFYSGQPMHFCSGVDRWWTIRLKVNKYLIGQICLRPEKDLAEIAVGYALDVAFWRQGYAQEAL